MNSQQFAVLVDTDLVSQTVNVECAPARTIGHAVVVAADGDQTFMAHASLEPDHAIEHAGGQRLQRGTFLAEVLRNNAMRGAVHTDIGYRVEPLAQLAIHVTKVLEPACEEEVLPDIAVRSLDLALGLGAICLAGTWCKTVMLCKRDQLRVVDDVLLCLTEHSGLHPVVKNLSRHAAQVPERFHVTAQHRLQILVLDEAAPQVTAVHQHDREQPDRAALSRDVVEFNIEVREVHLGLVTGRCLEADLEAAWAWRPHFTNQITQRRASTDITHGANLAQQTFNAQIGKLAPAF